MPFLEQDFIMVAINRNKVFYLFSSISLMSLVLARAGHLQVNIIVS
jgi:hypothetical protein